MKKLLATSAIFAAMTGAAFADPATNHPAPATQQNSVSLLDNLLQDADELSVSLSNVAQNLNSVDGSINLTTIRDYSSLADGIDALNGSGDVPFGSFSQAGLSVIGRDLPANLLNVLNPLTLTLGDLSTTAIGAMQSGSMTATVNTSGIVNHVALAATGSTTTANSLADAYGGIANAVAFQNIAVNSGDVNGSVQLMLADVNATVGKIGTTAIGAMGSGSLTATITGNMSGIDDDNSNIINALTGHNNFGPPPFPNS